MGVYDYEDTGFGQVDNDTFRARLNAPVPRYVPPIAEPEKMGVLEEFGHGVTRGYQQMSAGLGGAIRAIGDVTGMEPVSEVGKETSEYWNKKAEENASTAPRIEDVSGVGDLMRYGARATGEFIPQMGAAAAAAATGGVPAMVAHTLSQEMGSIYNDQPEEQKDAGRAFKGALPAAALDVIPTAHLLSRTGLLKALQGKIIEAGLKPKSVLKEIVKNAGVQTLEEVPTETLQTVFERYGANKPLLDEEAKSEYLNTAASTAMGMAPIGGIGGGAGAVVHNAGVRSQEKAKAAEEQEAEPAAAQQTRTVPPIGGTPETANPLVNAARAGGTRGTPETANPLVNAARAGGTLSRTLLETGSAEAATPTAPPIGTTEPSPSGPTSDEINQWLKNEIAAKNTTVMRQVGETQRAYNARILVAYQKSLEPRPEQPARPLSGQTVEMLNPDTGELEKVAVEQVMARIDAGWRAPVAGRSIAVTIEDEETVSSIDDRDRTNLAKARDLADSWEKGSRRNGRSNKEQLFPFLRNWGKTTPREVQAAIDNYLAGKPMGDVQRRLLAEAVRFSRETFKPESRAAAPVQGIGALVADRRALSEKVHEAATSPENDLPEPTRAQIEAGNYKKGHVNLHGLVISIENPQGSVRKGVSENGKPWETKLAHHYGYIKGTVGKDKDHLDVFVGPDPGSDRVFVVDQKNLKTGEFDEHKVMMGFNSPEEAKAGYLASYDESGPQRIMAVTGTTVEGFKNWLDGGSQKKPFGRTVSPEAVALAKQYAAKEKMDTDGWTPEDFSEFAGSYRDFLKGKSRSAAPLKSIAQEITERRALKGERSQTAEGKTAAFAGEEEARAEEVPTVQRVDGREGDGVPQVQQPHESVEEAQHDLQQGETEEETKVKGEEEIPDHIVRAVEEPRTVSKQIGTATKQQTKDTLNEKLKNGEIKPGSPIRLTTVEELHDILEKGKLREGKDFEGRSGISAQVIDGKKPIVAYGPNDKISAAIVFPKYSVVGKGEQPNEVKVSVKTDPHDLRFAVDGYKELMSFDELKAEMEGKTAESEKTGLEILPEKGEKEEGKAERSAKTGLKWDELSSEAQANATALAKAEGLEGYGWEQNRGFVTFNPDGSKFVREVQPGEFAKNTGEKESGKGKISPKKQLQAMVKAHYDSTEFVGPDQVAASKADLEKIKAFAEQHNLTVPPMVLGGLSMTTELLEKQKVMDQRKEKFAEPRKTHIEKKLAATQDAKEKARLAKVLEGLRKKPAVAEETQAGIDEEIKNLSMADLSDMFDEVAAEVQAEQAPALDEKANRAARFRATQKKHIKDKLAKAQEAKQPKEVDRLKMTLAKIGAGKSVESEKAALEKPEKDNGKESFFKKGQRVQLADGTHGEVSDVNSYVMRSAILDIGRSGGIETTLRNEEVNHTYNVRGDNGVVKYTHFSEMFPETDPAPEVIPAPVYGNTPVDPAQLLRNIQGDKDTSRQKQAAASRAKKREMIQGHKDAQARYENSAKEKQAVFDAWAEKYPEEAAKYLPKVEPKTETAAAAPQASVAKMSLKETVHSKKGHKLFVVTMDERVERDVYDRLNRDAKRTGNGYSAYRGHGAIPGFQFLDKSAAEEFLQRWGGAKEETPSAPTNIENGSEQEPIRTASDILKEAASQGIEGIGEAVTGLYELFGGASLKSFPGGIDESTYQKAKPHFQAALEKFRAAGKGVKDFFRFLIEQFGPGIKPYSMKFVAEMQGNTFENLEESGKIKEIESEEGGGSDVVPGRQGETAVEHDREGAADEFAETLQGTEVEREPEFVSAGEGIVHDGELRPGLRGSQVEDSEPGPGGQRAETDHGAEAVLGGRPGNVAGVRGRDYRIGAGDLKRDSGWKSTAARNLDIIELSRKIKEENRPATPEEQALLVKYTGWGAGEIANNLFPGYSQYGEIRPWMAKPEWKDLVTRVSETLSPEELKTAVRSTQYAHYTSEPIIRSIWKALGSMGFPGGKLIEPGSGISSFAGLMPDGIYKNSTYTGLEFDETTANIAKLVYPEQNVIHGDFTRRKFPNDFYDLAIGNPPFSQTQILVDPDYKRYKFSLHDYFFAKSIDKVRPGGLLVFITSRYTMDKLDDKARSYLADRADLLGAIRLPQTAFKQSAGTEVVTDVLFLRKRDAEAQKRFNALENKSDWKDGLPWMGHKEVKTDNGPALINEYFADHPEMVLGRHSMSGHSMYAKDAYTVLPMDGEIEEHFAKAVENLPTNTYSIAKRPAAEQKAIVAERDYNPKNKKEGGLYLSDKGEIMRVEQGSGVSLESMEKLSVDDRAWLKGYVGLRDALKQARYDQFNDGDWEKSLKELNRVYDAFVKKHGPVQAFTVSERVETDEDGNTQVTEVRRYKHSKRLRMDVEGPIVEALEAVKEDGKIVKSSMLLGRTIKKPERGEIKSVTDALAVSLDETGGFNPEHIAGLMNVSTDQVIDAMGDLAYRNPNSERWELADEYLSGDVVAKLEEAEEAARSDNKYLRNVEALTKAQPKPLTARDVTVNLGVPWLKKDYIEEFASEILGINISIQHNEALGHWRVNNATEATTGWSRKKKKAPGRQSHRSATSEWGTPDRGPNELLESILNRTKIVVTRQDENKKTYTDQAATTAANDTARKISERFKAWVWEDADRAGDLLQEYNRRFNNIAPRRFDGSHLTLPGVSSKYILHPHQKRAIWRVIQTGNTYLAHAVGSGKTIEMIASGMEMRRLGLVRKPLYVVPNHMLEQFASEFMDLYPMANIMVADEENFHTANRRRFMAQAAINDPDAIIITHSALGKLNMKPENVATVRDELLAELREAYDDAKDSGEPRYLVKRMEQRIEQAEQRFDSIVGGANKDNVVSFEEMGVDFMFLDEAHLFRKLDFTTNQQIKGIDPNGSRMALDLYLKTNYLNRQQPGRGFAFASGTPITNTMGELYTIMRFFSEDEMVKDGSRHFDAWSTMFGDTADDYEPNAAGRYELVTRFSKFMNLPELGKRIRQFMDVLTPNQLGAYVQRPDLKGGQAEIVITPASDRLKSYQTNVLQPRLENSRKWKPTKDDPVNKDPVINIITDGRLSSIDMRYAAPFMKNDPDSKLNQMIDKIIERHNKISGIEFMGPDGKPDPVKGATQIVFYNHGFGEGVKSRRGFDARKWMSERFKAAGIPASEVAWIEDYDTAAKKEAMFKEMRQGKKRILIGSAKKMGTGMNAQTRLNTLHYLDAPWYPADVEQPHGRILRQGNKNKEVEIYWYATKGSYDSTMWQMVARKGRFIQQFFEGDDNVRSMEDISEVSQYEMAKALSSGDDRVIKLVGIQAEIEKLSRLQEAHAQAQHDLRYRESALDTEIKFNGGRLRDLKEATAKISETDVWKFTAKIGSREYDKHKEFGEAIIPAYNKAAMEALSSLEPDEAGNAEPVRVQYGSLNGFPLVAVARMHWSGNKKAYNGLVITPKVSYWIDEEQAMYPDGTDGTGLGRKAVNRLQEAGKEEREKSAKLEEAKTNLKLVEKKLGAPFEYERDLAEKTAEAAQLQAELVAEGNEQPAQEQAPTAEEEAKFALRQDVVEEKLQSEIKRLRPQVDKAYEDGNHALAEELDGKLEELYERLEGHLNEQEAEGFHFDHEVSLEEDLAQNYSAMVANNLVGYTREAAIKNFRSTLKNHGADKVDEASDELVLAAAKDAYEYLSGKGMFAAKSPGIKSGIKSSEITASLSPILKNWANAPQIEVVQSASELPVGVRFQMAQQELDPSQVQAAFHGGGVTLVADNLASVDEAQRKVIHEVVGHYGLQGIMDDKAFKRTMGEAALWYANKKNAEWKDMAKAYGFDLKTVEGRIAAAEEMLAHEAESGAKSSILDRVVAAIRQALRQIGFELEMTDAEIRELLARARRFVEGSVVGPEPDTKVNFALRRHAENLWSAVSEAAANTKMADIGRFFNPFDWSRSREWMEDHTPENLQRAVAWLFRNPVFQAMADPLKRVFVDAFGERSVNRMQLMLDFFGWKPGEGTGEKGDRTVVDKVRDIFSWANGDLSTAWGKIQDDLRKLTPQQRTMLDKLFVEGDRKERVYTKLSGALKNHRLQGLDQATFDLYKKVRAHIDEHVSEVRLKAIERMMREGGLSKEEIARHISDYRKHFSEREGWLTRFHGEGEHVVKGYRVVKELKFDARTIVGGSQATLRFYPGVEMVKEISELAAKHGAEVQISPRRTETLVVNPGAIVVTKRHGGSLDAFLDEASLIVPDYHARTGEYPKVLVYNRFVSTKAQARKLARLVEAKPSAYIPMYAVKGEEFVVSHGAADRLSESMYTDMKNDFAVEAAQLKTAERMLKAGEMSREEFDQFKSELIRSTAEVLLGRAAGRYQIRRAPYVIEGYDKENVLDLYQDYMTGVAGMISKAQYAKEQFDNYRRAKADVKPWAEGYIKDSLRNMGVADRWSGNLRSFAALWYMGARPASALINSTQIWTLGQAELSRYTKSPVKTILAAQKSILNGDLTQEEKDIFNTAIYQLQEKETAMAEISGHGEGFTGRFSKGFHMVTDKAMALFQKVEVNNRKAMLLAAYRVFREQGVKKDDALRKAVDVNNAVNFDMGRENLPGFARNPAGRTVYALQSFAWNSFNWVYNRATSGEKKDMIALARYMGSILVIGGMAAIPGGDELDRLLQKLLGKSYQMEFKTWMKRHAHEYGAVGDAVHAFAWHGAPGTAGINISNALKQQIPLVSQLLRGEGVTESAMGVFGGLLQKAGLAGMYLSRGMYDRAMESALPEGVAGPMRAARMYEEGVTTSHGKPVFDEKGRPVKYSAAEAGARALGLQPLEQSERTQLQVTGSALKTKWNGERQDLLDAMRAADTPERRREVTRKIMRWNRDLADSQVKGLVSPIKAETIKNALTAKPDKKQMAWQQGRL